MLHVDGGEHINTGVQQLFHILPTLRVTRTWRIAVRQFVHQNQGRVTRQCSVEVELMNPASTMVRALGGQQIQPVKQRSRLFTPVSFHHANQNT